VAKSGEYGGCPNNDIY